MKISRLSRYIASATLSGAMMTGATGALADTYQVTVTNITKGEAFTPRLAITHSAGKLFTLGEPALPELATIAESGNVMPLMETLESYPDAVEGMKVGDGLLMAGESQSLEIEGSPGSLLTVVFMLVPTNDGFSGVNAVTLPAEGSMTWHASVYDAGSEPNDELCSHMPGPVCNGVGPSPEAGGEGYVYIHPGIIGHGDLPPENHDWNNPAAVITVTKM